MAKISAGPVDITKRGIKDNSIYGPAFMHKSSSVVWSCLPSRLDIVKDIIHCIWVCSIHKNSRDTILSTSGPGGNIDPGNVIVAGFLQNNTTAANCRDIRSLNRTIADVLKINCIRVVLSPFDESKTAIFNMDSIPVSS